MENREAHPTVEARAREEFIALMRESIAGTDPMKIAEALTLQSSLNQDIAVAVTNKRAKGILGKINQEGFIAVENLASLIKEPEDLIAFSQLLRARLLNPGRAEFTISVYGLEVLKNHPD